MPEVDLQKVQRAANLAHANFMRAIAANKDVPQRLLTDYARRFLDEPVERPRDIRACAERTIGRLQAFDRTFFDLVSEVGFTRMEQNLLVTGAQTASIGLIMHELSSHLDQVQQALTSVKRGSGSSRGFLAKPAVDQLMADAQNLGYAVAIVEQLSANLIDDRLQALHKFATDNLMEKTAYQVVKDLRSNDVVKVLFEVLLAVSENLALLGPIKKVFEIWDEKREPRAGVRPGHTDIMFVLDEILERDEIRLGGISSAIADAKAYAEALRARNDDVTKDLLGPPSGAGS